MTELTEEKWLQDISSEAKSSSTRRLLYELIQWDENHTDLELNIMCEEIVKRSINKKPLITVRLFLICFLQANFLSGFKEKFYVFDEDEQEVKRQLRICFFSHLFVLIVIFIFTPTLIGKGILSFAYIAVSIKWCLELFRPIKKRLKKFYH